MVTRVTSLGKNGLYDWIVQRGSALILGLYTLCVLSFLMTGEAPNYEQWHAYMSSCFMQIFTFLALIAFVGHAWVGLWTVAGDYLTTRQLGKPATAVRAAVLSLVFVMTVVYLVWGVQIVWGG
jgi:succinate dehydrogenase / fumarate reductase membrane anchor subunit